MQKNAKRREFEAKLVFYLSPMLLYNLLIPLIKHWDVEPGLFVIITIAIAIADCVGTAVVFRSAELQNKLYNERVNQVFLDAAIEGMFDDFQLQPWKGFPEKSKRNEDLRNDVALTVRKTCAMECVTELPFV